MVLDGKLEGYNLPLGVMSKMVRLPLCRGGTVIAQVEKIIEGHQRPWECHSSFHIGFAAKYFKTTSI